MLKSIHILTIREYSLFEKTGKVKHLLYIPISFLGLFYKKKIVALIEIITAELSGADNNYEQLEKEHHRQISYERIKYLNALWDAAHNLLVNRVAVNEMKELAGIKPTPIAPDLEEYQEMIKKATRVIVVDAADLIKLRRAIDFWIAKYHEHFLMTPKKKGLTFMMIVMGIFAAMDMRLEMDLSMSDFFDLKRDAELMASKKKTDGGQN